MRVSLRRFVAFGLVLGAIPLLSAIRAEAFILTFGNPASGFSAALDVSQSGVGANQLKIIATNTTTAGATTGSATRILLIPDESQCPLIVPASPGAACRLLASFGWAYNAISQNITAGVATVPSGETYSGDPNGPAPAISGSGPFDWSPEWGYANDSPPNSIGTFDFASTNVAQITPFDPDCVSGPPNANCPNRDGPQDLDGPQAGILSATYTSANGLGFVRDSLEVVLTFSSNLSAANLTALESATWFVEFGSGTRGITNGGGDRGRPVTEPGAFALLGSGLLATGLSLRLRRQMKVA